MVSAIDIAWAAGFIEGEGSFGHVTTACVRAAQVQREPLERLQRIFGGEIKLRVRKGKEAHQSPIYHWYLYGSKAAGAIMTMLCLLSPKRLEQAVKALDVWKNGKGKGGHQRVKTHCKNGHEFTQENTILKSMGYRACRACKNIDSHRRYHRVKGD